MTTTTTNVSIKDFRCPYCGRPVIGTFIQGVEGRYHPECTRPPMEQPNYTRYPFIIPYDPYPFYPFYKTDVTWHATSVTTGQGENCFYVQCIT